MPVWFPFVCCWYAGVSSPFLICVYILVCPSLHRFQPPIVPQDGGFLSGFTDLWPLPLRIGAATRSPPCPYLRNGIQDAAMHSCENNGELRTERIEAGVIWGLSGFYSGFSLQIYGSVVWVRFPLSLLFPSLSCSDVQQLPNKMRSICLTANTFSLLNSKTKRDERMERDAMRWIKCVYKCINAFACRSPDRIRKRTAVSDKKNKLDINEP